MGGGVSRPRDVLPRDRPRRDPGTHLRRAALVGSALASVLPAAGLLLAWAAARGEGGGLLAADVLFRGDLAALALAAAGGAFLVPTALAALLRLPAAAALAGLAHLLAAGSLEGALALALLVLAVSAAAGGLAALGRRGGAPAPAAGAIGAAVLWVSMTGLFWADDVSASLPRARQRPFRQAVLHSDPATAAAYSAAFLDRFHEPRVYATVPLASSTLETPRALPTGLAWLGLGLVGWIAATMPAVARRKVHP